ncbi:hypothetical protein AU210_002080 [Fusarium oxysporum f. sp. radicis-cucumerinum]|uniref:Uncharacterized protein n=2 Tax=Fusarium oxysporum TaxID=5507 RepID=A0A2H3FJT5_FUSOX|nr:hypothetical protein AU210_016734 [Fusarium oxysporum f. sp. radicis-cucumerinum]PCD46682.1 hypothetical protein AU210_002080 [Fusarium oxysporum f. sp. radicis-cucumerinum]RKK28632.1 hypothetical protein BFJ65_g574 [Fusarium oxysporum f. sp. cepae]RKK30381.1 hypothetical protein BFJ66_g16340 [Fusarium oxysporum f. sp. cepae]RKK32118.1 hypothetical protein BFJ67_g14898 [Fusarium oxysporum f. sp. cepae]
MDPNLELCRSLMHLNSAEHRQRLQHLPAEEYARVRVIAEREQEAQRLEELIAGRDLVQVALTDPSEIIAYEPLKYALLGRTTYDRDEHLMVERITNDVARASFTLVHSIANFDESPRPLRLDAWKLVYCDICYVDGGSATLQEIYEERLREEQLQTPAARARELVRDDELRKARRNAEWMIPAIERFSDEAQAQVDQEYRQSMEPFLQLCQDERTRQIILAPQGYEKTLERIWKRVSPAPPAWIQKILKAKEEFGFIYYMSRKVQQKHGNNWHSVWSGINNLSLPNRVTWDSIHCQGYGNRFTLRGLETEKWPTFYPNESMAEDDDLRKHFREYREENHDLLTAGILRNTFIVIPIELTSEENLQRTEASGDLLDPYWVWAYDADWDSSEEETVFNGEKYQGRVKVAIWSVNSWFYAARWEGVSLRDMWLKAQQHPEKLWICYTKELEEWDHEPYV